MKRLHDMPFGARLLPQGGAGFRLWAPSARKVELMLGDAAQVMEAGADGWFETTAAEAVAGDRYGFRIDGDLIVPDPASRSNPDDVHALSMLVDPASFKWTDSAWRGRPWHEAVIYELHIGCFTQEGTFDAAIAQLDGLALLGITAIELMPVADFPGRRNWGYDGVLPYAPDASYGPPEGLKRLVDAAHARGLMVLLDVVYNHFGPDGNYLHAYAPEFFNRAVQTPWGAAINLDGPSSRHVRDFFIHNALYWLNEFNLDGLRLDAVHEMHDTGPLHFIDELAHAVRTGPGLGRHVHLVLENELNDAARLARGVAGLAVLADAQWNDDVHHALHVMATGETDGYYRDFAEQPQHLFARALAEGFGWQGEPSAYRGGKPRGTPSTHLPPLAFVNSTQTHDQVGNRAFGERIATMAHANGSEDALHALIACVLLAPSPPMLFMGEEFAADTPFLYFCDFSGELAQAVTRGRREEFGRFKRFADPATRGDIPDPNAESTFLRSKLDWAGREGGAHAASLSLYQQLLRVRQQHLVPRLARALGGRVEWLAPECMHVRWPLGDGSHWHLLANLSDSPAQLSSALPGVQVYASPAASALLAPWSVLVHLEAA